MLIFTAALGSARDILALLPRELEQLLISAVVGLVRPQVVRIDGLVLLNLAGLLNGRLLDLHVLLLQRRPRLARQVGVLEVLFPHLCSSCTSALQEMPFFPNFNCCCRRSPRNRSSAILALTALPRSRMRRSSPTLPAIQLSMAAHRSFSAILLAA